MWRAALLALLAIPAPAVAWSPDRLFAACTDDCATAVYWGTFVEDGLGSLITGPESPTAWGYRDDHLVATAFSRDTAHLFAGHLHLEPEVGIGQRYGQQSQTEVWMAVFLRYRGFPFDNRLQTSFAISTGLNYASGISDVEQERARDGEGSRWMHFFAPEITFALPSHPDTELTFRFHHRSGVFGVVSDAWGGAQYATNGLRLRF